MISLMQLTMRNMLRPMLWRSVQIVRRPVALIVTGFALSIAVAAVLWATIQSNAPIAPQLTSMLPQGALLTIEAKDFAGVLKRWNNSPEQQAWLKSNNYDAFSRSRLFSRLGDAQTEFARAAGMPPNESFLNEVAGGESVFAWYDIGRLEFLYITRMPAGQAEKTRLVSLRGKFTTRQAGGQTFYVRTSNSPAIAMAAPQPVAPGADAQNPAGQEADAGSESSSASGEIRTVAFATAGDWLLLSTREDLMAGALMLMAQGKQGAATAGTSIASEPWFTEARAAAAKQAGDLRMTLNLDRIVPSPYFRSYWVQNNVTEMKQYRSAVSDLYLSHDFREERALLAREAAEGTQPAGDLQALAALVPEHAGVYRAVAAPGTETVLASLDEKLLARGVGSYSDTRLAPQADITVQDAGSAADLETRIDEPLFTQPKKGAELDPVRQLLETAGVNAMLTVSRTGAARDGVWVPFVSGVVLEAAKPWDEAAAQAALKQAVAARLTAGGLGLDWKPVQAGGTSYQELSDARPLEIAFRGKLCLLADDPALMRDMLTRAAQPAPASSGAPAMLIAGFDLTRERRPFARWTGLVDRAGQHASNAAGDGDSSGYAGVPGFFSQNMRGLGDAFSALESEQVVERREGALTRQIVTYAWKR